ncbi:hypothetical protein JTB14_017319 [Gonioctena quinquepunctata]|nr:hypothetical protein JTB14_017319 [Gonioctena quinquepunctata]
MTFPNVAGFGFLELFRSLRLLISRSDRRDFVSSKKFDDEWLLWWNLFHDNKSYFNNFTIARGDLVSAPRHFALAHCVSSDFKMSKGIALTFKQRFGRVDILLRQNQKPENWKKHELILRVKNCIAAGNDSKIALGVDQGKWYDLKRNLAQQAGPSRCDNNMDQ